MRPNVAREAPLTDSITTTKQSTTKPCAYFSLHIVETVSLKTWWRHRMETFSALLALCAGYSPVSGEFPSQRPVTRSFDFSLMLAWTNGWTSNRDAGDLKRHHAHYDATIMILMIGMIFAVRKLKIGAWGRGGGSCDFEFENSSFGLNMYCSFLCPDLRGFGGNGPNKIFQQTIYH